MALIQYIVWNPVEKRVRVGWRLLIYTFWWLYAPRALYGWVDLLLAGLNPLGQQTVQVLIKLVVVVAGTWLAARYLDRRPFADFGLRLDRRWWIDCGFGLALGALLMGLVFAAEWLAGWVVVVETFAVAVPGVSFAVAMAAALLLFVVVGVTEELLARGYYLLNLAEALYNSWRLAGQRRCGGAAERVSGRSLTAVLLAWLISSSLFGLLHIFNPNATWYTTLALVLAGLFLGLGFLLTGSLALPIGLHTAWNFVQGNVFGFPVSGAHYRNATLFAIEQQGPVLWTGGAFGPEAGLVGILAILLGCALTVVWVRWRYGEARLTSMIGGEL